MEDSNSTVFQEMQDEYLYYANILAKVAHANVIVKNIFSFLSLKDLKNCRYVCQNWNAIVEPLLRQRSKIKFDFDSGRDHTEFADTFRVSRSNLKFTSFKFREGNWPLSTINDFVQQQIRNAALEELEFSNVVLTDEDDEEIDFPLISDVIDDFDRLNIRKLIISGNNCINTDLIPMVSLDRLTSVKELVLCECNINVTQGNLIAPTKITFKDVIFRKDGTNMTAFCVNDIVEFKDTEYIKMQFPTRSNDAKISVDLQKCMKLKKVMLHGIEVTNWSGDKCNIEMAILSNVPFVKNNNMRVKKMHIGNSSVYLSVLPSGIEELAFYSDDITFFVPHSINFSNLKHLSIYGKTSEAISHFKHCPNLVELCIDFPHKPFWNGNLPPVLNLELIPRSVRKIKLNSISQFEGYEMEILEIDVLILGFYCFANAEKVLEKIKPLERLVLQWEINVDVESNDSVLLFLDKFKDLKQICVGPFYFFQPHQFTKSRLSHVVDRISKFYVFENHKGSAISESDFNKLKI